MIALPLGRVFEAKRVDKRVETRLNLSWTTATSSKESQDEFQDEIEGNTTKPGTSIVEIPGILSGWRDLNPRPLDPQSSALPSCATARIQFVAVATCRTIAHLAKERQADLRAPRHTRGTKGSRWILPTLHVRKTEQVSRRAGGDNTIPFPHNMHPREFFQ